MKEFENEFEKMGILKLVVFFIGFGACLLLGFFSVVVCFWAIALILSRLGLW